jgi:diguanylate cyclase (GGDEF)-like protein
MRNLSTRTKLFLSHFLAIVLVSGSIGSYFYAEAVDNLLHSLQSRLRNSAALIAHSFDVAELDQVRSPADKGKSVYVKNRDLVRALVRTNNDIAFIYVMRREGNRVEFVVDSDTDAPADPGEVYEEQIPTLMEGFLRPSADNEITTDKWGRFLSGYAPLEQGHDRYLVGIDMRADDVADKFEQLRLTGTLSLLSSVLFALVFSQFLSANFTHRIQRLILRCADIARQRLDDLGIAGPGDELDRLARAFDLMSERLEASQQARDRSHRELEKARDELEVRVRERTEELEAANAHLLEEIEERLRIAQVLEQTARTDFLTSLLNRRAMLQMLRHEADCYRETRQPFCLVLMDVDHFKGINDKYGHDTGDTVLVYLSQQLRLWQREQDTVCRWGGEEFLILMPDTRLEEAAERTERLRTELGSVERTLNGEHLRVTGSFGVCEHGGDDIGLEACIKCADQALYRAKREGRDRVVVGARPLP